MRKLLCYNNFCMGVFFRKKFSRVEDCAEGERGGVCKKGKSLHFLQ